MDSPGTARGVCRSPRSQALAVSCGNAHDSAYRAMAARPEVFVPCMNAIFNAPGLKSRFRRDGAGQIAAARGGRKRLGDRTRIDPAWQGGSGAAIPPPLGRRRTRRQTVGFVGFSLPADVTDWAVSVLPDTRHGLNSGLTMDRHPREVAAADQHTAPLILPGPLGRAAQ